MNWFQNLSSSERFWVDIGSVSLLIGTLVNMLPAVASILTVVWSLLRIYETKTVQRYLRKKRLDKNG